MKKDDFRIYDAAERYFICTEAYPFRYISNKGRLLERADEPKSQFYFSSKEDAEQALSDFFSRETEEENRQSEMHRYIVALELIAAPMRSDGTFNRDREACRQLAEEALRPKKSE